MAFLDEMLNGFGEIFSAPFRSMEALWVLIPLFLMWFVLEFYFARFKKEKLGWNTALANGVTLGWLTLEGMRSLFKASPENFAFRFIANLLILFYALFIIYSSFTHKISSKWDFVLASPTPVYFFGVFSVMWGFGTLDITRYVLLDLVILFIVVLILIGILRKVVKPAEAGEEMPSGETPSFGGESGGELPPLGGEGPESSGGLGEMPPMGGSGSGGSRGGMGELPPLK